MKNQKWLEWISFLGLFAVLCFILTSCTDMTFQLGSAGGGTYLFVGTSFDDTATTPADFKIFSYRVGSDGIPIPSTATSVSLGDVWVYSMAAHPNGRILYVLVEGGTNKIITYSINPVNGALAAIPGGEIVGVPGIYQGQVTPNGKFLILSTINGKVEVFSLNAAGIPTRVSNSPFNFGGSMWYTAVHPSSNFIYTSDNAGGGARGYSINQTTGVPNSVGGPYSAPDGPFAQALTPNGNFFYVANYNNNHKVYGFSVNPTSGALTSVGPGVATLGFSYDATVSPNGNYLYVLANNQIQPYTILSDGTVTANGSAYEINTNSDAWQIARHNSGFIYAGGSMYYPASHDEGAVWTLSISSTGTLSEANRLDFTTTDGSEVAAITVVTIP